MTRFAELQPGCSRYWGVVGRGVGQNPKKKKIYKKANKENTIIFITFLQIDSSTLLIRITNHSMYSESWGRKILQKLIF